MGKVIGKVNDAAVVWNEKAGTWCLAGTTKDGLGWETDDYEADTAEQALVDAQEYVDVYNENP